MPLYTATANFVEYAAILRRLDVNKFRSIPVSNLLLTVSNRNRVDVLTDWIRLSTLLFAMTHSTFLSKELKTFSAIYSA
jgi:hypothetical protein